MIQEDQISVTAHVSNVSLRRDFETDDIYQDHLTASGSATVHAPGSIAARLIWTYDNRHDNLQITSAKIWPDDISPDARREVALFIKRNIRSAIRISTLTELSRLMKSSANHIDNRTGNEL